MFSMYLSITKEEKYVEYRLSPHVQNVAQACPNPRPGQIALEVKILLVFLCRVFGLLKVKAMESFHRFLPKK